jgi:hypothetical protein
LELIKNACNSSRNLQTSTDGNAEGGGRGSGASSEEEELGQSGFPIFSSIEFESANIKTEKSLEFGVSEEQEEKNAENLKSLDEFNEVP